MLKVGVFGAGQNGKLHLDNWKEIQDVELVGFFETDDDAAEEVKERYNLQRFSNVDDLLRNVDAADILSPTVHHFELCKQALRLQKHVFIEKPLAATIEEANEIVKLVKEADVKLQVGHAERFNPAFLAARGFISSPMYIEVQRHDQYGPKCEEINVILDMMIHDLDIILALVKSPVKHIETSSVAVMTESPDIANVRLEFNNGCVANLTSSRIGMKKMRKVRSFQRDAYVGIDFLARTAEIIKRQQQGDYHPFSFDVESMHGNIPISIINPEIIDNNDLKLELEAFRDAIIQNTPTHVSAVDGFLSMEVAQQVLNKITQATSSEG